MAERTGNVINFARRPINEWPKSVYLADLGDGDGSYCFVIDSGIPSQWGLTNYGRTVAYPKRVEALKTKLAELGELVPEPQSK